MFQRTVHSIYQSTSDEMNFIDAEVGARLRRARLTIGRSVAEQAALIGVGPARLEAFEEGSERVSAVELHGFCETLGLRPAEIYGSALSSASGRRSGPEAARSV